MTASPAALGRSLRFSTDAVRPAQRFAYWSEAICASFVHLELDCDHRLPFRATLTARPTPRFDSIDVSGSAQRVIRSERLIDEDHADRLILMRQRRGHCVVHQDGQASELPPGGLAVVDSRRPYTLHFPDEFSQTVIRVPALALQQRLGRSMAGCGRTLLGDARLTKLAIDMVDELGREERDSVLLPLSSIAFDLLALALLDTAAAPPAAPRLATLRVGWAKAQVLERLRDPQLSPRRVAEQQGVSPRLLQRLFAAAGESLSEFILEQRLNRCRETLADATQAARSVTDIALSWGFNDPAQFSKAFKRRFGVSPRDWRAAAGLLRSAPREVR